MYANSAAFAASARARTGAVFIYVRGIHQAHQYFYDSVRFGELLNFVALPLVVHSFPSGFRPLGALLISAPECVCDCVQECVCVYVNMFPMHARSRFIETKCFLRRRLVR